MSDALPDLGRTDRVAIDTETTGVGVRDVPVGISWAVPDGRAGYLRWGHQGGGNNVSKQEAVAWAREELRRSDLTVFLHNALFDLRMLANVGANLVLPGGPRIEDTGFMAAVHNELEPGFSLGVLATSKLGYAKSDDDLNRWCAEHFGGRPTRKKQAGNYWRAPGHVVEEYATDDAILTLKLADYYAPLIERDRVVYEMETALIPLLFRMYQAGVPVDENRAKTEYDRMGRELDRLEMVWHDMTGGVDPASRNDMIDLFRRHGIPLGVTSKGNPSVNVDVLEQADHPITNTLKQIRRLEKMRTTFIKGYILDTAVESRVRPTFHPLRTGKYGTVSGRFSASNPNLQNAPSPDRDEEMGTLFRSLFKPESGRQWLKLDFSQVEYRFFAHYAGGQIRDAYQRDPDLDFHQWCADTAGVDRSRAKNGNFAKLYGAGIGRLANTLGVSVDEARTFMTEYDQRIPEAAAFYKKAMQRASRRGYICTWGGGRAASRP